jgi:hypothetical protein
MSTIVVLNCFADIYKDINGNKFNVETAWDLPIGHYIHPDGYFRDVYYNSEGHKVLDSYYEGGKHTISTSKWKRGDIKTTKDTFSYSEVVNRYNKNEFSTYKIEKGGIGSRFAGSSGTVNDPITPDRAYQIVYTYEITTTRYWYKRITYYRDLEPKYSNVYEDKTTSRLINTGKIYRN